MEYYGGGGAGVGHVVGSNEVYTPFGQPYGIGPPLEYLHGPGQRQSSVQGTATSFWSVVWCYVVRRRSGHSRSQLTPAMLRRLLKLTGRVLLRSSRAAINSSNRVTLPMTSVTAPGFVESASRSLHHRSNTYRSTAPVIFLIGVAGGMLVAVGSGEPESPRDRQPYINRSFVDHMGFTLMFSSAFNTRRLECNLARTAGTQWSCHSSASTLQALKANGLIVSCYPDISLSTQSRRDKK